MSPGILRRALKKLGNNKSPRNTDIDDTTQAKQTLVETGVLPTLICEMVIDSVAGQMRRVGKQWWHYDTMETLQACSLTCRAWTPRSQLHLFRFLRVRCSEKQVRRVIALLDKNPALRSRIEVLVIRAPGFLATLKPIPLQLSAALPDVPELCISRSFIELAPSSLIATSMGTFTAVTVLALYHCYFGSRDDICRLLVALPRLHTLALDEPSWVLAQRYTSVVLDPEPTTLRLKVLRMTTSAAWLRDGRGIGFFEWLARSGAISSLEFLVVNTMIISEATYDLVRGLVEASAKTVQQLSLTFSPEFDYSTSLCETFGRCTNLRDFGICVPYHLSAFGPLVTFLAGPHPPLATLLIRFREYPRTPPPDEEAWRSLDAALQGPQWSSLSLLTVSRVPKRAPRKFVWGEIYPDMPFDSGQMGKQLRKEMPLSLARGILWNLLGLSGDCELLLP